MKVDVKDIKDFYYYDEDLNTGSLIFIADLGMDTSDKSLFVMVDPQDFWIEEEPMTHTYPGYYREKCKWKIDDVQVMIKEYAVECDNEDEIAKYLNDKYEDLIEEEVLRYYGR